MGKLIWAMTAALLVPAVTFAGDYEVKKKAGDYEIAATIDKNPPAVGDNTIEIEVKDFAGKPVTDATVGVEYLMPAMPGMPAINYKATDAALKGRKYKAMLNFSAAGPWNVVIRITRDGKMAATRFNVDVR